MLNVGFFGRVASRYWDPIGKTWRYCRRSSLLLKILAVPIFILYLPLLILSALMFTLLVPLELLASAIDSIRTSSLRFYTHLSKESSDNFSGFPIIQWLLVLFGPIILVITLIPKLGGVIGEEL